MNKPISRRTFLRTSMTAAATALAPWTAAQGGEFSDRIKKAVKYHMIEEDLSVEDKLKLLRDLGFQGVEPRSSFHNRIDVDAKVLAAASEKTGIAVHGVVNSSSRKLREAIDEAKFYGATSVLTTIPGMPKSGSYLENYRESQEFLRKAADHAEKQEIYILIENVWASCLIEPLSMARFIDEIDSPFLKVYFDVGNVVRWGWPHNWVEVLGKRIVKLDIKEYNLDIAMNEGMRKGFGVPIGEGSVEWDKVRQELAKIDYSGWATAEVAGGDRNRLADVAAQMNKVLDL